MDTVKVYKKNPAGAGGTNDIDINGDKWFLVFESADDKLEFANFESFSGEEIVLISNGKRLSVKVTPV